LFCKNSVDFGHSLTLHTHILKLRVGDCKVVRSRFYVLYLSRGKDGVTIARVKNNKHLSKKR